MCSESICNCRYDQKRFSCLDYFIYHNVDFEEAVRYQMWKGINCYNCRFLKRFGFQVNFETGEVERIE